MAPKKIHRNNSKFFLVDEILDKRINRRNVQYLIKWTGFDESHNSWEPTHNLSEELVRMFEENQQNQKINTQKKETQKKETRKKGTRKKETRKKKQLVKSKPSLSIGDFCFGKVKGYKAWPGFITEITGSTIWVKFFNSLES